MSDSKSVGLPQWAYAFGRPSSRARLRVRLEDFEVHEQLGFEPSGSGEHEYLLIEKIDLTTERVADLLAKSAGVARRNVSYAGMKDRRARTRQWFSILGRREDDGSPLPLSHPGLQVLASTRHARKLRRGAHRANRFRLILRDVDDPEGDLEDRLTRVSQVGVPNYFGEQRFGREAGNVDLAHQLFGGRRLSRHLRSIALSAARSLIFNELLSARVEAGTWNRLLPGDVADLDGSRSIFDVEEVDAELDARCERFDVHPTGSLWGRGAPRSVVDVAALETLAADRWPALKEGLEAATDEGRRALRMRASDFSWQRAEDELTLHFELPSGCFATSVIREIFDLVN